jgi:hypothetical protein
LKGKICTMTTKPKTTAATAQVAKRPRAEVLQAVCEVLARGESLEEACRRVGDAPTPAAVMKWVDSDPEGAGKQYAHAREIGYRLLGDRIDELSRQTTSITQVHRLSPEGQALYNPDGTPQLADVVVSLSADVIASKRLQVDTLKWKLSKMLPKIYGDKIVNEHTGKDGGPIALAAVDLKNLSDDELAQMQALMGKVATGGAK